MFRAPRVLLSLFLSLACAHAGAADDIDGLARDVDRLAAVRQVKDVQRSYAHYGQFGLWDEMASLFTSDARFMHGTETLTGPKAIAEWLTKRGGGRQGLAPGALHTQMIDEPLVNLAADGQSAKARWMSMSLLGDGKGKAWIAGGIYENQYVREGPHWKISVSHYYPQYSGSYETGWTNEGGADLPVVPYHFTVDESGVPIPPPAGAAPRSGESFASLAQKIDRFNDEDAIRNVQHAYGYYVDRKMWDDVVDLFAEDCAVEIGAGNAPATLRGRTGVRQIMGRMGPAGLQQGQLNERPLFDTIVQVLPGGREAVSRGIELAMVGEASKGTAHWEVTVFRNRFVKENGLWKLKELRLYPLVRAEYARGWGDGGLFSNENTALPAFAGNNPATGRAVDTRGMKLLGAEPLTGKIAPAKESALADGQFAEARRRLFRSMAYDGTENVSSAYGYYIDDFQWPQLGAIFAEKGNKQSPFAGYYMGRERIAKAATTMWGTASPKRSGISYHWRTQLVVHVAVDGRSANLRTRLFQPRTGKEPAKDGFYSASLFSGMYPNDQTVLENGIWRLWSLEIDEPYFTMAGWKGGWSGVQPKPAGSPRPAPSPLVTKYPPDILMTELGKRAEHFRGGTGETIEWPGILPMWFNYRNPVSGRVPEKYWPDCVPCELKPESQMMRHGYLMPPTGPEPGEQRKGERW